MENRAMQPEDPVFWVRNMTQQYGCECRECLELTTLHLETNMCPQCGGVVACRDVSFELFPGEILGVVGESGSGKSTLLRCLNLDETPSRGEAYHVEVDGGGCNLFGLSSQRRRWIQAHLLGIVYQAPHLGLNLEFSAGANVAERLLIQTERPIFRSIREQSLSLLGKVSMPVQRIDEITKGFSGGMQQRVQIAKALATRPTLVLLDEPTSGLDVSVQASVLDLIGSLQRETGVSMLVVSHDLGVIRLLTHRTMVMKMGHVVEEGLTDQVLEDPQHPYTQQLVASVL
jgi:putative phosphonate transport system ATP-binding protein